MYIYLAKNSVSELIGTLRLKTTIINFIYSISTDEVKTWRMVFPRKQMQDFGETSLYFEISDGDMTKDVILEFNENSGYIFIQTDKPIYNPRQTGASYF